VAPTISVLIASTESGDRSAADALFSALYGELHALAQRQLAREGPGMTLGVTTLLHEAYLDMANREGSVFPDKARFMGYAARVMRSLIIDYARNRKARKRGGEFQITTLDENEATAVSGGDLEGVGAALEKLTALDPTLAEVVDLKFFCGFSLAEIAAMRGVSERTVQRHWEKARIYLRSSLGSREDASS
jgi:RNA polymerase sigma factor (TIGR02999 family)